MPKKFVKPNIVISKCIEFENCRYNAQIISSDFVKKLKKHVNFTSVCPEMEIGLGVPRDPIRIVLADNKKTLIQPTTNKDVTTEMIDFSQDFLGKLVDIDGFILKSRSPSCGVKDVRVYPSKEKSGVIEKGPGFFGKDVAEKFNFLPIEDEGRLRNPIIRENFLKKIYTFARFREIKKSKSINELIKFHTENKFLLMNYSQKYLKNLGKIVANQKSSDINKILLDYQKNLYLTMSKAPRCNSSINVLQHTFGYVSDKLIPEEKKLFLTSLENFKLGRIPLSVPINLVRSWAIKNDENYLLNQTFFQPYPDELLEAEAVDVCSARDYWK